jgi:hypothetical protein
MFEPALAEQNNKMVLDQFSDTKTRKTNGSFAVKLFASHGVETSFPAVQCRVKTCRSECSRREDDPGDWKNAWRVVDGGTETIRGNRAGIKKFGD